MSSLLETINSPEQLRALPEDCLPQVAEELRTYLLESLNVSGGHLGAGLGCIELTLALHYVFNTPDDRLVWDVGHQAYPHKILTGRRDLIETIRKKDGLAPFPARDESPYDAFGVGHSSTSIGAALGMSWASEFTKSNRHCVAIIGDGGMTAGMAFEALNHAGAINANLLVILNDNDMSISNNVGALSNYFARILSSKLYASMRSGSKKVLGRVPPVWEFARRTESHLKGMVAPGTLFEELGFNYMGPLDGHDLPGLVKTLRNIQTFQGPQFLHVITKKGRGYTPAEANPIGYHAVSPSFYTPTKEEGDAPAVEKKATPPSYSKVFGDWLCDTAVADKRLVAITPAMREGSGMVRFAEEHPDRYVDVGIAEQHAVTLAAGMACEKGLRPVVAIYSSFLQRAYDQFLHDVALQQLPVVFALDRASIVGDGPTHSGVFDLSFLRCVPNVVIMAPSDEQECRDMLTTGMHYDAGPCVVRYPRGAGRGTPLRSTLQPIPIGRAKCVREGSKVALLVFGALMPQAEQVAQTLGATLVNMRFIKPLDEQMILSLAQSHDLLVTLEENVIMGGAGSAVNELLAANAASMSHILNLGLPDYFIPHGSPSEALAQAGLDADGILKAVEVRLRELAKNQETELSN